MTGKVSLVKGIECLLTLLLPEAAKSCPNLVQLNQKGRFVMTSASQIISDLVAFFQMTQHHSDSKATGRMRA